MSRTTVERAKDLAHRAHAGQADKAGRPYIEHVARVAAAVSDDLDAEAVAWLHDVLEDGRSSDIDGVTRFPANIYYTVTLLTRCDDVPRPDYYAGIRQNPIALRVKLADIADNADERRLALLDDETASRLRNKYARARDALGWRHGGEHGRG